MELWWRVRGWVRLRLTSADCTGTLRELSKQVRLENIRFANDLMAQAGICTVVNLADNDAAIEEFAAAENFDSAEYLALYENGHVIALDMDVNFRDENFSNQYFCAYN